METPVRKGKRGPLPRLPENNASEQIVIRVTPGVKHIYKSLADNFGLTETDLFYHLMAMGNFMNVIMPVIEQQLYQMTEPQSKERNELFLARFKVMVKAFSLISDLENARSVVRGKNQNTNPKQVAEIGEYLIEYLEKKFKKS